MRSRRHWWLWAAVPLLLAAAYLMRRSEPDTPEAVNEQERQRGLPSRGPANRRTWACRLASDMHGRVSALSHSQQSRCRAIRESRALA